MSHSEHFTVVVGHRGNFVLPAEVREHLGVRPGDRLIISIDDDGAVRIVSARDVARRSRGMYRHVAPGRSLADELIADRRREAQMEDVKDDAARRMRP
jgi:AbrB family looped-hinge helix DNA binding protein